MVESTELEAKHLLPVQTSDDSRTKSLEEPPLDAADVTLEVKELLHLAGPVVATSLLEFIPGFTCSILAGHLGTENTQLYVDATVLSVTFMNVTAYSLIIGLFTGLDTLCSQAYGAKRYAQIGVYFQTALILAFGICVAPLLLFNWNAGGLLVALGQEPEVIALAQRYIRISILGWPFMFLYEIFRRVLQAQNIVNPPVVIIVLSNIVNTVGGYLLTYHTSLGFDGVPISRVLGNMAMCLLLIPYFYMYPSHLTQWWRHGWDLKNAWRHLGLFLRLGIPGALMVILEWWSFEILSILVGLLPNAVLALSAHSVVVDCTSCIFMINMGVSIAANVRVGNQLGAKRPMRAKLAGRLSIGVGFVMCAIVSLLLGIFRREIAGIVINAPDSIELASQVLLIWAPLQVVDGLNTVTQGVFRGAGEQTAAATVNFVAYYFIGLPLSAAFAFRLGWGVEGAWLGIGAAIISAFCALTTLMSRWKWDTLAAEAESRTLE